LFDVELFAGEFAAVAFFYSRSAEVSLVGGIAAPFAEAVPEGA
jgi:hypothetical protein